MSKPVNMHGTCVALSCAGHEAGVLLQGGPGSGKSSLALQLIDRPGFGAGSEEPVHGKLVSDDQVLIGLADGIVTASAPPAIAGLLEMRGSGIIRVGRTACKAQIDMVLAHAPAADMERLPVPATIELCGQHLPLHEIDFSAPSAAAHVRCLALIQWGLLSLSNS